VRSFAYVNVDRLFARITFDVAAPVKLTVAPLRHFCPDRVVSSPAAHEVASIHSERRSLAAPAVRSAPPGRRIRCAVVGRLLNEDDVFLGWARRLRDLSSTRRWIPRNEYRARFVELDLGGRVVLVHEAIADLAEAGQLVPAGLHAARTGDSVTFAGCLDVA